MREPPGDIAQAAARYVQCSPIDQSTGYPYVHNRTVIMKIILEAYRYYEKAFFSRANFIGGGRFGDCAALYG